EAEFGAIDESGDESGRVLAVGDFNGDGYDDLALGLPGEGLGMVTGAGSVLYAYGGRPGLVGSSGVAAPTPTANARFGSSLAVVDFNGDGYDDIAVGAPGEGGGVVYVFPGGADGFGI